MVWGMDPTSSVPLTFVCFGLKIFFSRRNDRQVAAVVLNPGSTRIPEDLLNLLMSWLHPRRSLSSSLEVGPGAVIFKAHHVIPMGSHRTRVTSDLGLPGPEGFPGTWDFQC